MSEDDASGADRRHPVLVVGAGPVGLSAALALRARGVRATLLEADPAERVRPGSRAIYTHGVTLRLFEQLRPGLGWRMAEHGVVWPRKRTLWRGREVFSRTYPPTPGGVLPPFTSLPQADSERLLLEACKEAGVELVWSSPVRGVESSPHGVTLFTEAGDTWSAEYVIAADGARSAVRRGIGVPMEGSRSESAYVIVDTSEDPREPLPPERVFHYEHPGVDRRNVLLVPFAGGWRADLQCRVEDDPDAFSSDGGVRSWVAVVLGEKYAEGITWVSTYRFLQVVAREFTDAHRRVLLVGEAAHLFAPFGARGMNSGVVDADAAAEAVRAALAAAGPDGARAAVGRYASERHKAAQWNRHAAGIALDYLQARRLPTRIKRRVAAGLAPRVERAGQRLDSAPYGPRTRRRRERVRY
jgi:3-(3-hydroxy-phenyl)propionate hydroxylase